MSTMPKPTEKTGHRKATPADLENRRLVEVFEGLKQKPTRREAQNALKKIRPAYKGILSNTAFALLDRLVEISRDVDWQGGPILIWQSNGTLADYLMRSERTVQYALRDLREANFITFIDRPNRNRSAARDADQRLQDDGSGIDLRPLAARTRHLMVIAERFDAEMKEAKRLRRVIRAEIPRLEQFIHQGNAASPAPAWITYARELASIADKVSGDSVSLTDLQGAEAALKDLAEQIYEAAANTLKPKKAEMPPAEVRIRGISPRPAAPFTQDTTTTPPPFETKGHVKPPKRSAVKPVSGQSSRPEATEPPAPKVSWSEARAHLEKFKVTPALVMKACPSFLAVDQVGLTPEEATWADLARLADTNRHVLGIHATAWDELIKSVGHAPAVVAMAIVTEKTMRGFEGRGEPVASPGGYVRWLARTPQITGALDLGPKIHALLGKKPV